MHKFLNFPFDKGIYTVHHIFFNPMSSHGNISLDKFSLEPMEPIKLREELIFISCTARIYLWSMIELPILYETMIQPKYFSQDQHKIENQNNKTSHKIPRDNQFNFATPPRVKQFYKEEEKVVDQPPMTSLFLPSQEENKHIVEKPTPTQTQLENQDKRNRNAREHR
jgi:hypothetical protein